MEMFKIHIHVVGRSGDKRNLARKGKIRKRTNIAFYSYRVLITLTSVSIREHQRRLHLTEF